MKFYTYCHIRKDTGKIFYIGKGSKNRYKDKNHRSQWWKNISNKTEVEFIILAHWDTEEEAFDHEKFLISCLPDLCNLTNGGDGASGFKHSKESREKRSATRKQWHKDNPAAAKIWAKNRKVPVVSDLHKEHLRQIRKGTPLSLETRKKISESSIGKKKPCEFGEIISNNMKELWKDQLFREKQKAGIIKARGKAVIDIVSGNIFPTVTAAVEWLRLNGYPKMSTSTLSSYIKAGKSLSNSKFEYKE